MDYFDYRKFIIPWYMHIVLLFLPLKHLCSDGTIFFYKRFKGCTYIIDSKEFNPSAHEPKYDTTKLQKPSIDRQDEIHQV